MPNTSIPNSAMLGIEDNDALLTYRVGPVYCCGPTLPIVTITPPPPLTHPPGTSIAEPGIFKHGSLIVSATDLRYRFGVKQEHWKHPGQVIIAQHNDLTRGYFVDEIKDVISMPESGWRPLPSHLPRGVFSRTLFLNDNIYLYAEFDKLSTLQGSGYLAEYIAKLEKAEEDKKELASTINKHSSTSSVSRNISHKTTNDSSSNTVASKQTTTDASASNPVASNKTTDASASNPVASKQTTTDGSASNSIISKKTTTDRSVSNPITSKKTITDASVSNPITSKKTTTDASVSNPITSKKTTTDASASNPITSKKTTTDASASNPITSKKTTTDASASNPITSKKTTTDASASNPITSKSKSFSNDKTTSHIKNTNNTLTQDLSTSTNIEVKTTKIKSKDKVDTASAAINKDKTTLSTTHKKANKDRLNININKNEMQQVANNNTTVNKKGYQQTSEQEETSGIGFLFLLLIMLLIIGGGYYYYTKLYSKSISPTLIPTETEQIEFVEETNIMSNAQNNRQESIANNTIDYDPVQSADASLLENNAVTKGEDASYREAITSNITPPEKNITTENNLKAPEYHAKINKDNDTITIELGGPLPPKIKSVPIEDLNTSEKLQEANPPVAQPSEKDNPSLEINIIKQPHSETSDSGKSTAESNNDKIYKTNSMEITHVIVKGDTLWAIAKHYLQNPFLYPELAKLSKIKNPDLIYPGNLVRIIYRDNKK